MRAWGLQPCRLLLLLLVALSTYSPSTAAAAAAAVAHLRGRHVHEAPACTPKKMLWFTAIAGIGPHLHEYKRSIRAAVMSARTHAPSLVPHLLINTEDVQADRFMRWYQRAAGGTVHRWNLTFKQQLHDAVHVHHWHDAHWLTQYGAYMRIDIPLVIKQNLEGKVDLDQVDLSYVLYTDADVLFNSDINTCTAPPMPPVMLVGGDFFSPNTIANTGVTFINVQALAEHHDRLVQHGERTHWPGLYDQTLLLEYFSGGQLTLLPSKFNWTPSWGMSGEAVVIHFHGPKPERCLTCLVVSLMAHDRRGDFPHQHCGCPEIYLGFLTHAVAKDEGEAYVLAVLKFYQHLAASFQLRAQ